MIRLALQSLRHYWRANIGVFAGTLIASAILTGALLAGNSVDYSLQTFVAQRLGDIGYALDSRTQFISADFAPRLQNSLDTQVTQAMRLRGMAIHQGDAPEDRSQINKVEVFGVQDAFWSFGQGERIGLAPYETALSAALAQALNVNEGDEVSLRVAKPSLMARDSPLSWRDEERTQRGRYTVKRVLTDEEMGRFGLNPTQMAAYNAFVNLDFLQQQVEFTGLVNLVLVAEGPTLEELNQTVEAIWTPEDIGLKIKTHPENIVQLETERIFLSPETARAANTVANAKPTITYLVNALEVGERLTPYFFVVAGPVPKDLQDDEIVINRWTADELQVGVGDRLTLSYMQLLSSNDFVDQKRDFTVHSIREMDDLTLEKELMPVFPGLVDVESCADWDVGMPMDEELLNDEANEAYWDTYRQTPKAFVTLAAGSEMWTNRFGSLTAVRYPADQTNPQQLAQALKSEIDPALAGLFFNPVGQEAQAAVSEAMDFGGLFLGMSFFLILSVLILVGLLFVFGIQQRASQMGTLLAIGFRPRQVTLLILGEGTIIALLGAIIGANLGTYYTRALIYGLTNYWGGAVANSTILYHAEPATIVLGAVATLLCAIVAMAIALRRLSKQSARELLTWDFAQEQPATTKRAHSKRGLIFSTVCLAAALIAVAASLILKDQNIAPIFFGAGALTLTAGIGFLRHRLMTMTAEDETRELTPTRLALLNLARRPGRATAVAGLMATGCFMVFAVSSMQEDLYAHADSRTAGTGGFALVADATFPLLENPIALMEDPDVSATAIKVRDGDDASCLNLNHAQTPRLLGVNIDELATREAFSAGPDEDSLWRLLDLELPNGAIPALIGDANTAMWTLKKKAGIKNGDILVYKDESGAEVDIKLVGKLPMTLSVFQGSLLISQEHFTNLFPSEDGFRMFLIDAPQEKALPLMITLSRQFDRFGLDAIPAVQRVLEFYAVESTYLAMFLVLGGLGLAIGSTGVAVVILRNMYERRSEIAMMKALGIHTVPLQRMLFTEYGMLIAAGLGIGALAALVAMLPAFFAAQSTVAMKTQLQIAIFVIFTSLAFMTIAINAGFRRIEFNALRSE